MDEIFIVGAARGIGRALAELYVARGERHLILADIDIAALDMLAAQLRAPERTIEARALDIGDPVAIDRIVAQVGPVKRVALVAGVLRTGPALDVDSANFESMLRINLLGNYRLAQGLVRNMIEHGLAGSLAAVTSISAVRPMRGTCAYAASKAALTIALKSLASEVVETGVRINFVLPGPTRTDMLVSPLEDLQRAVPMGRINEPQDIARALAFLLSDDSAMMTMRELSSDGGMLAGM